VKGLTAQEVIDRLTANIEAGNIAKNDVAFLRLDNGQHIAVTSVEAWSWDVAASSVVDKSSLRFGVVK
jgi:hypothetical protein